MHTRRQKTGQETRETAEQTQAPPAANLVEWRAAEESLHHPHLGTTPEGNPAPGPQGITEQEVVLEGPLEVLQEVGNPRMTVLTNGGDGGPVPAPQNRRRRMPPQAEKHPLEKIHLHRTPPTTPPVWQQSCR